MFHSERHRDALAHLLFGIGQGGSSGFVQLTGEVGTGKTTLCRLLLEQLPDRMTVYEATYGGPSEARVETRFQRMLDPRGPLAGPQLP